jgi:hypothetical protein
LLCFSTFAERDPVLTGFGFSVINILFFGGVTLPSAAATTVSAAGCLTSLRGAIYVRLARRQIITTVADHVYAAVDIAKNNEEGRTAAEYTEFLYSSQKSRALTHPALPSSEVSGEQRDVGATAFSTIFR